MKKLTNVLALEMVLALEEVKGNQELFDKLTVMKDQFDKKNKSATGEKKLTKTQQENEKLKIVIRGVLQSKEKAQQIKEIMLHERIAPLALSNQKISALLRQMLAEGTAYRLEEKGTARFYLCETPKEVEIVVDNE